MIRRIVMYDKGTYNKARRELCSRCGKGCNSDMAQECQMLRDLYMDLKDRCDPMLDYTAEKDEETDEHE